MSGGSYNYAFHHIDDLASEISKTDSDPRRASFVKLLKLVAKACHDIEWVDSCDYGPGDDHKAIDEVFSFLGNDPELIKKAHAYDNLKETLLKYFEEE